MKRKATGRENLYIILAFVIMGILYYSTSMSYEDQNVQPLLGEWLAGEPLREWFERIHFTYAGSSVSVEELGYTGFIEFFIRKGAHFGSYFLLGMCWFLGLKGKTSSFLFAAFLAVLLSAGYASFDELRQAFHPHRTALLEDVALDTAGALTGVILTWIFIRSKGKRRKSYSISWL